ncbi:hypothetical protein K9L05_00825 [Candidatus Babeliales bacterium]|nr:hypothetical protein [Candidatus Babeliales bacterium]
MNKFINFKKTLFSLFLLSLSFSHAFLMEDSEPMEQVEQEQQPFDQTQISRKHFSETQLDCLEDDIKQLRLDPDTENLEREWEQMTQEDAQAQELKIDNIIFQSLCGYFPFTQILRDSENWFNFYHMFKHKINPYIENLSIFYTKGPNKINANKIFFFISQNFSNLKKISFACDAYENEVINLINTLPNLQSIEIVFTHKLTNQFLYAIGRNCPKLQSLNFWLTKKINNEAILALIDNCHNLKILTLKIQDPKINSPQIATALAEFLPDFYVRYSLFGNIFIIKK